MTALVGPSLGRASAHGAWRAPAAGMFVIGWGGNHFTPLLSVYRHRLGFSQVDVNVLLGAYVLGLVPGLLVASALSDHVGRRPVMTLGLASSLAGSLLLAIGEAAGYPALLAGRALVGVAVGVGMSVGTAWVTELSRAPHDPGSSPGAGARRSSILLTLGFATGPGVAAMLAQWSPAPLVWPFAVHAALTLPALWAVHRARETRHERGSLRFIERLRVPAVAHRRFVAVVLPLAPWVFASAGVAYAIVPQVVAERLGSWELGFTAALTVATLLTGVLVQPIARRLDDPGCLAGD